MDFDNIVTLYDEDGNEIEFEIIEQVKFRGKEYFLLWGEDEDEEDVFVVVTKNNGEYEVVDDDEVIEYVKNKFRGSMSDLQSVAEGNMMADDFMKMLENEDDQDEPLSESITEPFVAEFNYNQYVSDSQNYSFKQAMIAYGEADYEKAYSLFKDAVYEGNVFAHAHVGIMHHYGYGCFQSDEVAIESFREGAKAGCPLAASWLAECHRMGYAVTKDKEYATKLQAKSLAALKEMCKAEDVSALYFLGFNLIMGIGVDVDDAEGVRLLETAVYKGDAASAIQLAECYLNGWGVPENPEKAVKLLIDYPLNKNKKSHYLLGRCYFYGQGVEKDLYKAAEYFKVAAELGHGNSKDFLGDCYYYGYGLPVDYYEAARWYKDAVDNHMNGSSAHSLAFMYLKGQGVPESEREAVQYFKIAAEKGIAQAQRFISREYLTGEFLPKSYQEAKKWMEAAAEQGDEEAQIGLGKYYVSGFGFDDDQKAFEWFRKAAEQGNAEAEYIVGGCYQNEVGVKENYSEANSWYMKAVRHGHMRAAYELGINYLDGRGIEKDSDAGIQLLEMAVNGDIKEANKELASRYHFGINNFRGQAIYKNPTEAQRYATVAVEDEHDGEAQFIYGSILDEDFGNSQTAVTWYQRAIQNGNKKAKLNLSRIYVKNNEHGTEAVSMLAELAKDNIGEAQFLYAKCLENGFGCNKDKKSAKQYYQLAERNGYVSTEKPKKRFGFF